MAFPTINAQQEINYRKILEDIQLKKQLLDKGVNPGVTNISNTSSMNLSMPQVKPTPQLTTQSTELAINSPARAALNIANTQSFGFFLPQDSLNGNNIIPVLPRLENTTISK